MFVETLRCCPVCRRVVAPSGYGRQPVVPRHHDRVGRWCPMAGQPYELTEQYRRPVGTWAESA